MQFVRRGSPPRNMTLRRKSTDDETMPGQEHERADKSPGVHPESKSDGTKM
jgi:hypothetical protein